MSGRGIHLDPDQRRDWLRLIRTENVGPRAFRGLINRFGGAAAALEALPGMARRGGRLIPPRIPTLAEVEAEIAALERIGARLVALGEPEYPALLREIDDAPPLIAMRGRIELLSRPAVAIVGSRNASGAGRTMTARIARGLGEAGWLVVSGLARGIDADAHAASLATGTAAVIAGGLDRPYPRENDALHARIVEQGVVLTEMPMGWEPRARDFPRRNRLVSGMTLGVVVVEAAERSGSLITARLAGEQGREVLAVPGSPLDPRAAGTNGLIKQGAALVTGADDVIEVLSSLRGRPSAFRVEEEPDMALDMFEPSDDARSRLLGLLGTTPLPVDDLVSMAGCSAAEAQIVLLELELAGRLERHAGGRVSLLA
ncbi:DNA-processing protein DprA [Ancylobacter amanitiformis]|uniref:DNA processing protein n=1 Tax=Ancylobacter amanitiformis TaxID=217069 RepID=A0ABU0LPN7_9HYPH|nr:DNA-processing protein DprA [Ancylobacter amanitiformis]MDQ0510671.1 DNA processing protein [Ancylobacter amanitiformis]